MSMSFPCTSTRRIASASCLRSCGVLSPGFIRYYRSCAPCHGDDGHPPGTLAGTFRRPQVAFDAAYFAHTSTDELETAIWHMLDDKTQRMPHFARVLDE